MNNKMILTNLLLLERKCQELSKQVIFHKVLPKNVFDNFFLQAKSIISDIENIQNKEKKNESMDN